jgi:hypothetical protein
MDGTPTQTTPEEPVVVPPVAPDAKDVTLKFLNETLKRDFTSLDDAAKTLANLNSMVGDQAIAALRKDSADFSKVVEAYSKSEGVDAARAKELLFAELSEFETRIKTDERQTEIPSQPNSKPMQETDAKFRDLEIRLQERDLKEVYPESGRVMTQLKDLAKVYPEKDLKTIYEASGLKEMAALAHEKEKADAEAATKPNASVPPNAAGTVDFNGDKMKTLVQKVQSGGLDQDRIALVTEFFAQQQTS